MQSQELEVKFYLVDKAAFEHKVTQLGAKLSQPRIHEVNLRFDTPQKSLTNSFQVLRLRQDQRISLTFKGSGGVTGGVRSRDEIEFHVDDLQAAQSFLEKLGYQVIFMYEKYRTTYHLNDVMITVDEMPYGNFCEIEGPDAEKIQQTSQSLMLKWNNRILVSYAFLFEVVKENLQLTFRDLSFQNFQNILVSPEILGVTPAE